MSVSTTIAQALRSKRAGSVHGADDAGYDDRRQVWNGATCEWAFVYAAALEARLAMSSVRVENTRSSCASSSNSMRLSPGL